MKITKDKYLLIIAIVAILISPWLFSRDAFWSCLGFDDSTAHIGDTIGGITAPIIGLISIYFLYQTLKEQIQFNREQISFNREQVRSSSDEQFKSTLFTLLSIQKEISKSLSESQIIDGEKSFFVHAADQLSVIYVVLDFDKYVKECDNDNSNNALLYYNSEIESGRLTMNDVRDKYIYHEKITDLFEYAKVYKITENLYLKYKSSSPENRIAIGYMVFYNRYNQIGGYFRHLYNILKFIKQSEDAEISSYANSSEEIEKIEKKYWNYAQFIQSQMSFDELLLLFYNSYLFDNTQDLINHYDLLENLPVEKILTKEQRKATVFRHKSLFSRYRSILNKS